MHLAQERDQWRDLVNMKMNLWVPQKAGKALSRMTASYSDLFLVI
jgi:hypothetical protein